MNTERITYEIQQMKGSGAVRIGKSIGSTSPPSISEAGITDEDGRSMASISVQSENGGPASQYHSAPTSSPAGGATEEGTSTRGEADPKPRKTKRQLWDDLTISGKMELLRTPFHSPARKSYRLVLD